MRVMRIRFGLAYSPLPERSTRITRAYHDVIVWILPRTSQYPCMTVIQGQPGADLLVLYSYLCCLL